MTVFADGTLVRERPRPEVWYIEGGLRRWVPDSATVDSLGGWDSVVLVDWGDHIENGHGAMWPSVVDTFKWDDGSLIAAWPDRPHVYMMAGGTKRWITSPKAFEDHGLDWNQIMVVSTVEVDAIPDGPPVEEKAPDVPGRLIIETGDHFLGAGHYMASRAALTLATGEVAGLTTTRTVTWFGGFHGGVYVIVSDADDIPIPGGQSPLFRYGVDGTAIGRSQRTDSWSWVIDPAHAQRARGMTLFHTWAPDDFQTILDKWVATGERVARLVEYGGRIAAVAVAVAG